MLKGGPKGLGSHSILWIQNGERDVVRHTPSYLRTYSGVCIPFDDLQAMILMRLYVGDLRFKNYIYEIFHDYSLLWMK